MVKLGDKPDGSGLAKLVWIQRSIYWGGGEYQPMSFGEKNMTREREKGENVKEKKGRKGKGEVKG
jgi:hypothetical protein